MKNPVKVTIDVKQREQRGQNNGEKNNCCETKENITGFNTEDEPKLPYAVKRILKLRSNFVKSLQFFVDERDRISS